MSLQMALFHSFFWLSNMSCLYVPHLLNHSSLDGHLGCFHIFLMSFVSLPICARVYFDENAIPIFTCLQTIAAKIDTPLPRKEAVERLQ